MDLLIVIAIIFYIWKKLYDKSVFYKTTKASIMELIFDPRRRFQYKAYTHLRRRDRHACILLDFSRSDISNIADVVYIAHSGIYLFQYEEHQKEIYGDMTSERWLQKVPGFLRNSTFNYFDNPLIKIKENSKNISKTVGEDMPIYSYLVFSKHAKLKQIFKNEQFIRAIKENVIEIVIENILKNKREILDDSMVNEIIHKLMPVSPKTVVKEKYIEKKSKRPITFDYSFPDSKNSNRTEEEIIGARGEKKCYDMISIYEKTGSKILRNIYLPKSSGETTEIDMLMISQKGIFVFECKNYKGWIFGNSGKKYWYQTLPKGYQKSESHRFYNPIFQNNNHIKALKYILDEHVPYYSILSFSDDCTFKTIPQTSSNIRIAKFSELRGVLNHFLDVENKMTSEHVNEIYDFLYPYTKVDEETKRKHVERINERFG